MAFLVSKLRKRALLCAGKFPGADRPNPLSLKGWTTGRETQRGPKSAREQAVSRKKPPFCQMKGLVKRPKPSFRGDAKHRTRNLEIPRCATAHLRFVAAATPRNDGWKGPDQVATARTGFGSACCLTPRNSAAISVFSTCSSRLRALAIKAASEMR